MRASNFAQRRILGTSNQNQARALRVCQRIDGFFVSGTLFFKSSQGTETRSVSFAFLQKAAPRSRQLQQPDGMSSGSGVENDVVVLGRQCRVGQQRCELVEGRNFSRTSAGKLLFDALDHGIRQNPTHRADNAITVCLRRSLRVDLQCRQTVNARNGSDVIANADTKYLARRWTLDQC